MAEEKNQNNFKFNPWWIYTPIIMIFLFLLFNNNSIKNPSFISTSKFNDILNKGQIEKVIIYNKTQAEAYLTPKALQDKSNKKVAKDFLGHPNKGPHYYFNISDNEGFVKKLEKAIAEKKLIDYDYQNQSDWSELLFSLLPILIIVVVWIFIMRRMSGGGAGGGGGQIFNIGKSKAKLFDEKTDVKVTFKDVAGLEGAKEEVQEIVEFLKNPDKYTSLGGKIPKGALLVGALGYYAAVSYKIEKTVDIILLSITLLTSIYLVKLLFTLSTVTISSVAKYAFVLGYVILPFIIITRIPFAGSEFRPKILISIFILIWTNDTFAYLVGKNFGKRKLFEKISPKKTIEGFVGGMLFTVIAGILISRYYFNPSPQYASKSLLIWAVTAVIISVFSTLGDLIESKFKRMAGVKDSGKIMPGHGGILDRLDSIIFVAPFVFLFYQILYYVS